VLQSDEVIARVMEQTHIDQTGEFDRAGLFAEAAHLVGGKVSKGTPASKQTIEARIQRALTIRRLGTSNAVEVGFTSKDAFRAAEIANAFARSYIDNQRELKQQALESSNATFQKRLAELRAKAFANNSQDYAPKPETNETEEQARARLRETQDASETYRVLYNNLLQRHYMDVADQLYVGARVISSAEPPLQASWPRLSLLFAFAAAGGLVLGVGHAFLRQATDKILRTADDVSRSTGSKVLACVPKERRRGWTRTDARDENLQQAYTKRSKVILEAMEKVAVRLGTRPPTRKRVVIGVVAPNRGAGSSTLAAHLALIHAGSGQKTLLVDANWSKASALDCSNAESRRTLLRTKAEISLEPDRIDVLVLRPPAPLFELAVARTIVTVVQQAPAEYDCIIVDLSSTEETADLEAVMAALDRVLVVVAAGTTSTQALCELIQLFSTDKHVSMVLNTA
jgi:Mrp family chromosome partitioning ATPase